MYRNGAIKAREIIDAGSNTSLGLRMIGTILWSKKPTEAGEVLICNYSVGRWSKTALRICEDGVTYDLGVEYFFRLARKKSVPYLTVRCSQFDHVKNFSCPDVEIPSPKFPSIRRDETECNHCKDRTTVAYRNRVVENA